MQLKIGAMYGYVVQF